MAFEVSENTKVILRGSLALFNIFAASISILESPRHIILVVTFNIKFKAS
jgi:hypothetical protein